jgi:DivIVA domain-containing protein
VSYQFNRAGERKLGYNIAQVDEFLKLAREQYDESSKSIVTAFDVRSARFELEKNGYSISVVDAALEKLEDVFAANEFGKELLNTGYFEFREELDQIQELILARCNRRNKRKFKRRIWPNKGYSTKQVDIFCSWLGESLEAKSELSVKEIRIATFRSKRGGYAEYQVDAFLEKIVETLQREQALQKISR